MVRTLLTAHPNLAADQKQLSIRCGSDGAYRPEVQRELCRADHAPASRVDRGTIGQTSAAFESDRE
jgi:hypothetical protein